MSDFVEVKTAELLGAALDWAVLFSAYGDGPDWRLIDGAIYIVSLRDVMVGMDGIDQAEYIDPFHPSTRWQDGGPIIENLGICILQYMEGSCADNKNTWTACARDLEDYYDSPTPLIAACRAVVASKLGVQVSIPAELVK